MPDILLGKLVWATVGKGTARRVCYPTKNGGLSQPTVFDADQLDHRLAAQGPRDVEVEVELELVSGKPCRIRPKGEAFQQKPLAPVRATHFHNPYNFVPVLDRSHVRNELGDSRPVGHDRYVGDRYSGRITVTMTTVTPLLCLDPMTEEIPQAVDRRLQYEKQHKSYDILRDRAGRPQVQLSSFRNMLRSAYEAVTNSRFAVIDQHAERLGMRMDPLDGLKMVPCRIEPINGKLHVVFYTGDAECQPNGQPKGRITYAARLPSRFVSRTRHGDRVKAIMERGPFAWTVKELVPIDAAVPGAVEGYACITGNNMTRKKSERLFFIGRRSALQPVPVDDAIREKWTQLIRDYYRANEADLNKDCQHPPALPANQGHVYSQHIRNHESEQYLREGTLAYARVNNGQLLGLYPVIISRKLYDVAPIELMEKSVLPAKSINELSAADRVFGWVSQTKATPSGAKSAKAPHTAYRGNLRIDAITCITPNEAAVSPFSPPLPLAILGQPKPQQARFYVGERDGTPILTGQPKEDAGYRINRRLRGRKVYPHHRDLPADYWVRKLPDQPFAARTVKDRDGKDRYREYLRIEPADGKVGSGRTSVYVGDSQNKSIRGWVNPGTQFRAELEVTNLSAVELGALLWLLEMGPQRHHRLGGAKPLGFGSVQIALDPAGTDLRTGTQWAANFETWTGHENPVAPIADLVKTFKSAVIDAYPNANRSFEAVPFIAAFIRAAEGFADNKPVHYPRNTPDPASSKSFEWFVANEKRARLSLPPLANDQGLPHLG